MLPEFRGVSLGLGLIGIGRPWGVVNDAVPDEGTVLRLLEGAFENGIRFFDTAPAYGLSERRLGQFLRNLGPRRDEVVVATKCGEMWSPESGQSVVDHSFDGLRKSIDRSLQLLEGVDVLQLHKTRPDIVAAVDTEKAFEYARSCRVRVFGASVSDLASAKLVCDSPTYAFIQFPYNGMNTTFALAFDWARSAGLRVLVNRPFNMGKLLQEIPSERCLTSIYVEAFQFILRQPFDGLVLTGTKCLRHLAENISAFQMAHKNAVDVPEGLPRV